MNRKFLVIFVALMVAAMLATPLVGFASAGKGQDKLDFNLTFIGSYQLPTWELITTNTAHYDLPFVTLPSFLVTPPYAGPAITLTIGGTSIPSNRLSYSGVLNINENSKGAMAIRVEETITIKAVDGSVMGTLEIQAIGNVEQGNGVGAGNNFVGFGTGTFNGVKISGNTVGPVAIGTWNPIPTLTLPVEKVIRVGTVMGWP